MCNSLFVLALLIVVQLGDVRADEPDKPTTWTTRSGYYVLSFESELDPLTINRMHRWIFHIEDATGIAIEDATVSLTGGMPEHNHGLPTNPRMTESLGSGNYVVEGMRFHMNGYWELTVTIDAGGRRDTVVISLTV